MTTVIIGYGVVGKNVHKEFPASDIVDPAAGHRDPGGSWDVGFCCVPTDSLPDGSCDTSIVEAVIKDYCHRVKTLVIKSTVPPGTTEHLGSFCVFSPEYYGATVHANAADYDFVILGGSQTHRDRVAELYKLHKPGSYRIHKTDSKTAEYVKYMENFWLAAKVTFVAAFNEVAQADGIDIDELRELWLLDPRINRSHTYTHRARPYYDSHCLNKDTVAFIEYAHQIGVPAPFLAAVVEENKRRKA